MRRVPVRFIVHGIVEAGGVLFLGGDDVAGFHYPDTDALAAPGIAIARVDQRLFVILGMKTAHGDPARAGNGQIPRTTAVPCVRT